MVEEGWIAIYISELNPWKAGIEEVAVIFWTISDPPGLQGLIIPLLSQQYSYYKQA